MASNKKTKSSTDRARGDASSPETPATSSASFRDGKLRVFISWSGERSKALAHALRGWLPLVLHYVEPWVSESDIDAGERWADAVAGELEASNFGIICVTRQSVAAPWLLFEAGALAKSLQGSVIPLLLDLDFKEVSGPLAQFQAKKAEKQGLLEIVRSINIAAGLAIPESRLDDLFQALWTNFEKHLASIPSEQAAPKATARTQGEVLEELVGAVRSLDLRLRDGTTSSGKKFRRVEAMDFASYLFHSRNDLSAILVLASIYRDDMPWMHEILREVHRLASSGRGEEARQYFDVYKHGIRHFPPARNALMHGGPDDFELLGRIEHILDRLPRRRFASPPKEPMPSKHEAPVEKQQKNDSD